MENVLKLTENIIECPNCHYILTNNEFACPTCNFDLTVRDNICIADLFKPEDIEMMRSVEGNRTSLPESK